MRFFQRLALLKVPYFLTGEETLALKRCWRGPAIGYIDVLKSVSENYSSISYSSLSLLLSLTFYVLTTGGEFHAQVVEMTNYSFEVFVCLAVLEEYRKSLLRCSEVSSVYNTIHRWERWLFCFCTCAAFNANPQCIFLTWAIRGMIKWLANSEGVFFTHHTLTSICMYSVLFSIHFLRCWQG